MSKSAVDILAEGILNKWFCLKTFPDYTPKMSRYGVDIYYHWYIKPIEYKMDQFQCYMFIYDVSYDEESVFFKADDNKKDVEEFKEVFAAFKKECPDAQMVKLQGHDLEHFYAIFKMEEADAEECEAMFARQVLQWGITEVNLASTSGHLIEKEMGFGLDEMLVLAGLKEAPKGL